MSRLRRTLVTVAPCALGLLVLAYLAFVAVELKRLGYRYDRLAAALASAKARNERLAKFVAPGESLQQAKNIIDDQEAAIKSLDKNRNDLYRDLLAKDEILKKRDGEIADLKERLRATQAKRDDFQDLLAAAEKNLLNTEKEMARVADALKLRDDRLERLLRGEKGEQVPELPEQNIRGKIVTVDKKLGVVTLNVGQKQGVRKGYPLIVFRDAEYVGKVIVTEVRGAEASAARYDRPSMKMDPEPGDEVALRLMVEF